MHYLRHRFIAPALLCLAASCGPPANALTTEEAATTDHGNDSATAATNLLTFADGALFQFDPTLNPASDPPTNAGLIRDYAESQFGACATVVVRAAVVTITLNGSGCTLPNGTSASGTMTLSLTKMGTNTTIAIAFANATIDGRPVSGTLNMTTSNASDYSASGMVTSGANSLTFSDTQVTGIAGSFTINGAVVAVKDGATTNVTLSSVVYRAGDCYPSGGTARIMRGMVTSTITFTNATASTGTVSVSTGRITTNKQLPAYGACPGTRMLSDAGGIPRRDAGFLDRDR